MHWRLHVINYHIGARQYPHCTIIKTLCLCSLQVINMNTTAFLARCLLLVLLQAIINSSIAGPAPKVPCPKGKDAGCNITTTGQLEPENCKGDECTSTDSDQIESSGMKTTESRVLS